MRIEDMTPRRAYEEGYRNGESSLLADVNTLCDQLGIEVGEGQHEFAAIRVAVEGLREAMDLIAEQAGYIDCDYELIARLLDEHGDGRRGS